MNSPKIAIMQPYIFPYIGYFQLIGAADKFLFYDDVNFIKQGWINRNKILINGKSKLFTIPVKSVSSFRKISDTEINLESYSRWKSKFYKSLQQSYSKANNFERVFTLVQEVLEGDNKYIGSLAARSVVKVCEYLGLDKEFSKSSSCYPDTVLMDKEERLLHIIEKEGASHYINAEGGKCLYSKEAFIAKGIKLSFLKGSMDYYAQGSKGFIPGLSIIDVLMFNDIEFVNKMLNSYYLE